MKKQGAGSKNLLVGITGGIGAGKSTAARVLSEAGYPVISADSVAREITAPGSEGLVEVTTAFGPQAVNPNGSLNRNWLRSQIAADPEKRLELEAITHPRIQARCRELSEDLFRKGHSLVFYEAPLLFEAKSSSRMDKVICVHAPDELRIQRVLARDGRSKEEAEKLLSSQMPQEEKMRQSDYLIPNEGDEAALKARTLEVLAQIRREAGLD